MTSDACRTLHKLEVKRDNAVNACAEELRRLIGSRLPEYSAEDALAQAIMDVLLARFQEASIAAATSFLEGCGYVVTPSDYPERGK
jgi:hypothetical protein